MTVEINWFLLNLIFPKLVYHIRVEVFSWNIKTHVPTWVKPASKLTQTKIRELREIKGRQEAGKMLCYISSRRGSDLSLLFFMSIAFIVVVDTGSMNNDNSTKSPFYYWKTNEDKKAGVHTTQWEFENKQCMELKLNVTFPCPSL